MKLNKELKRFLTYLSDYDNLKNLPKERFEECIRFYLLVHYGREEWYE